MNLFVDPFTFGYFLSDARSQSQCGPALLRLGSWGKISDVLSQMFSDVSSLFHHCFTIVSPWLQTWTCDLGCTLAATAVTRAKKGAVLICICESKRAVSTRMCAKMSCNFC